MPVKRLDKQQSGSRRFAWGVCGFLLLVIGLIYGQTLGHPLLGYDDNGFVYNNPQITAGVTAEGIRWAFTDGPFGEWYPLDPLSHMLDCELYGLNAWGHHLTNMLLHAAASIALFLVLWQMTNERFPSALVAVIFAVHPQHVESVAWISERRDVLSGLFFMLTLGAYLAYVGHRRSKWRYALVAAMLTLGLMAKPMLVTLPAVLLLLDFWPLARVGSAADTPDWTHSVERLGLPRLMLEKLPLVALVAVDCVLTLRTHYAMTAAPLSWPARFGNAAVSCVAYVAQFFYPVDLAAHYPLRPGGPPAWTVASAIAILVAASMAAVTWRRRCPYFFVGWFWYLGMLTPVLGLVGIADHARADRYMYLPGIGLYIALAWAGARLARRSPQGRGLIVAGAWLMIALLTILAARQTSFWRDDETLWLHALKCTSDNALAEVSLGTTLAKQGRYDQAIPLFRDALKIRPDWFEAHIHLGAALARVGQPAEAMQHFERALAIDPHNVRTYLDMGELLLIQGRFDDARAAFSQALEREPASIDAHNLLGVTFFLEGKLDKAIAEYEAALVVDPNFVLGQANLAEALAARGQTDAALQHFRRALAIDRNNVPARTKFDAFLRAHPNLSGQRSR